MSNCDVCTMPVNISDNYCALCGQKQFPTAKKAAKDLTGRVKDMLSVATPQLTHNCQPVNLDAILDLAAAWPNLENMERASWKLSDNDHAFLAERLGGG